MREPRRVPRIGAVPLGLSGKDVVITRRYTDEPAFSSGCNLFEATL